MAVRPPDKDQLAVLARDLGMDLDEADCESYRALVAAGFASYDAVEELSAQVAPEAPADREHTVPDGDENPLGAWYVTTDIHGAAEGPLAGRTVAIKDNTAVAGGPMMKGSHTLAGFVPRPDAAVGSPLVEAGGAVQGGRGG